MKIARLFAMQIEREPAAWYPGWHGRLHRRIENPDAHEEDRQLVERVEERNLLTADGGHRHEPQFRVSPNEAAGARVARKDEFCPLDKIIRFPRIWDEEE